MMLAVAIRKQGDGDGYSYEDNNTGDDNDRRWNTVIYYVDRSVLL